MSKKRKKILKENITTMGGVVSRPIYGLDMGFKTLSLPNSQISLRICMVIPNPRLM